jgi:hypothetical protein
MIKAQNDSKFKRVRLVVCSPKFPDILENFYYCIMKFDFDKIFFW